MIVKNKNLNIILEGLNHVLVDNFVEYKLLNKILLFKD